MSFTSLIDRCNQSAINRFANADIVISLSGVEVKTVRGIFDESNEVASPFESDRIQFKPAVSLSDSDMAGITSAHTLTISGKAYQFDGKPRPDGHGMTLIYLTGKR